MKKSASQPAPPPAWTFLSNHGHVLLCLAGKPAMRLRDVAAQVCITERAVQRIVADLEEVGYLRRRRCGRRNRYEFHGGMHLRHPVEGHRTVGELMEFVLGALAADRPARQRRRAPHCPPAAAPDHTRGKQPRRRGVPAM